MTLLHKMARKQVRKRGVRGIQRRRQPRRRPRRTDLMHQHGGFLRNNSLFSACLRIVGGKKRIKTMVV